VCVTKLAVVTMSSRVTQEKIATTASLSRNDCVRLPRSKSGSHDNATIMIAFILTGAA
jgi:hypothetical protein